MPCFCIHVVQTYRANQAEPCGQAIRLVLLAKWLKAVPDIVEEEWPHVGAELVSLATRTPIGQHMCGTIWLTLFERTKARKANTDVRKRIEKTRVDGVSEYMDSRIMEGIHHILDLSVDMGGQRLTVHWDSA